MHASRTLSTLLFTACFAFTHVAPVVVPAAHAQTMGTLTLSASQQANRVLLDAVRESIRLNPALADGTGEQALLSGVRRAVAQHPELKDSIVASANSLRPHLAPQIQQAANIGLSAPAMAAAPVQAAPAATPAVTGTVAASAASSSALAAGVGTQAFIGLVAAAGVAAGVAAATGGSSGGGGSSTPPPTSPTTQEYDNQWGLAAINAQDAYDRGGSGAGIKVAVLDSGLDVTHSDINDNVDPNGYNFADLSTDVTDDSGHGTHVAGIIAAERDGNPGPLNMHGVAFSATVLPIRIFDDFGTAGPLQIAAATDYARTEGAQVLNGSYGPDYSNPLIGIQSITAGDAFIAAAYQQAADAGVILVFSAGNDYATNPTVAANPAGSGLFPYIHPTNALSGVYNDSGADYDFTALEGMLVTVVATQENGAIAPYSNRCGVAAAWCIAAPGSDILSLLPGGNYGEASGTSMAAPHVSGALAILLQMFPMLTPEEIVDRLLTTADKTGIYADATIYGQGFLDLEQATRPLGGLSIATGDSVHDGKAFLLSASHVQLGQAFGDGLKVALIGQKLAVFDQQNAAFMVDLGDFARTADSRYDLDGALRRFHSRFGAQTVQMPDGGQLSYTMVSLGQHQSLQQDPALGQQQDGNVMELAYSRFVGDMRLTMGYNVHPSAMFGLHQSEGLDSQTLLSRDAFAAPYLSFVKQGFSMGTQMPLSDSLSMNVGAFRGYPLGDEMRPEQERAESFGHMAELAYRSGGLTLTSQVGMLTERNSFLGSRSEGAFDLESGTHTSFAGLNGAFELTPTWSFVGSYYRGISSPRLSGNSLFNSISDVQTESFSLGMVGKDVLRKGDGFGILGNQPMRVVDGQASLSLATGRSQSGLLYSQNYDVNLAPSGRELNMEAFYHFNLPDTQTKLMSAMMYRSEPGHIENAPDEGLFLLQVQQSF